MDTFEKLLAGLSRSGVEYILVGGLAVELCGFSRATMDVDILIRCSRQNIEALLNRLVGFGNGSAAELNIEDFNLEEGCIRVIEEFPLDIFTIMGGKTYEDLLPDSSIYSLDDTDIRFLDLEGLIAMKSGSSRPKDQIDVQALKDLLLKRKT